LLLRALCTGPGHVTRAAMKDGRYGVVVMMSALKEKEIDAEGESIR
jgi:hypothetical protein